MSDVMTQAVIRMPFEMAMQSDLTRKQYYSRAISVLDERDSLLIDNERLRAALELIATPKRPDGTYNNCREACECIAAKALKEALK